MDEILIQCNSSQTINEAQTPYASIVQLLSFLCSRGANLSQSNNTSCGELLMIFYSFKFMIEEVVKKNQCSKIHTNHTISNRSQTIMPHFSFLCIRMNLLDFHQTAFYIDSACISVNLLMKL